MSGNASQTTASTAVTARPPKSDRTGIASFQFLVTTPSHRLGPQDRKAIKGNATRQRKYQRRIPQLQSWIVPGHELASLEHSRAIYETAIPKRAGTDFSGLQLPPGFEPHMLQELIKGFHISKMAVYPYEICIDVPPAERGWFPYMLSDACCLHSMMFSLHVYDGRTTPSQFDRLACYHYDQTLRLLQSRLHECDLTNAVSDATIMVVIMLASVAEMMKEHGTVEDHIRGLEKMVKLRGGVRALTTHTNMPVKVCRADLSFALSTGRRPLLFDHGVTWKCFIAGRDYFKSNHNACHFIKLSSLESVVGIRLQNVMKDVHALSCLSNLAYQTKRKLSPELYNEMTISILYRLAYLSCEDCDLQEGIRLGLLCFCSTVFMQRQYMEKPYGYLLNHFMSTLRRLYGTSSNVQADQILFWLLMISAVIAGGADNCLPHWHGLWLQESMERNKVWSWAQAKDMLRSIAWIDFVHDQAGKAAFDEANHALTPLTAATGLTP